MPRRPEEAQEFIDNSVFSSDAWGNSSDSSYSGAEVIDLSKYAAKSIPQGRSQSARTARYSPSAHSSHYETSHHVTNSEHDPFGHSFYEGTQSHAPQPQNTNYDEMNSPVRRTRLGSPIPAVTPDSINHINHTQDTPTSALPTPAPIATKPTPTPATTTPTPTPAAHQFVTPSQSFAPASNIDLETTTFAAPIHKDSQEIATDVAAQATTPTTTPAMPVPETSEPTPATTPTEIEPPICAYEPLASPEPKIEHEIVGEMQPLSDFEQEFLEAHPENIQDEKEDHLSTSSIGFPQAAPTWSPPALFSTGIPEAPYKTSDDFFSTPLSSVSDEELLYADDRKPRETIQINLDFISRIAKNITVNKIAIILIAIVLAVTAYLVVKPNTDSSSTQQPTQETIIEDSTVGKTVVPQQVPTDTNPEMVNTVPVVNPGVADTPSGSDTPDDYDTPAPVRYDAEGNIIYYSNQNFNGE